MRTEKALIFKADCERFPLWEDDVPADPLAEPPPLGHALSMFIYDAIRSAFETRVPEIDEDGWLFAAVREREIYMVEVHWLPRKSGEDCWACYVSYNSKRPPRYLDVLCETIHQAVARECPSSSLSWVTREEYNRL